jgi:hypothetical protein
VSQGGKRTNRSDTVNDIAEQIVPGSEIYIAARNSRETSKNRQK